MSGKEDKGQIALPVDLFVAKELSFVGSFGRQAQRYPEMLRMVHAGQLLPVKLVEQKVAIEKASDVEFLNLANSAREPVDMDKARLNTSDRL